MFWTNPVVKHEFADSSRWMVYTNMKHLKTPKHCNYKTHNRSHYSYRGIVCKNTSYITCAFIEVLNVVYRYCNRWRLKANVCKSAVMVFSKDRVEGRWKWGEHELPKVSSYCYLGIDFTSNGAWDVHIKKVISNGRKKVNQLHSVISNRDINLTACRLLLLSVIRPSIEYGGEIWEGNKGQV